MTEIHVVRVFTDEVGGHGNPLGIVLEPAWLSDDRRQAIAKELGFSETVFVDNVEQAQLRIFTPDRELALAGHPLVGTSWLLSQITGRQVETLRPLRASNVDTWADEGITWVRARIADAPPWRLVQMRTPGEVDALPFPPPPAHDGCEFWAWQDEARGVLRARFFAPSYGVPEDEATGSGALRLVELLQRPIVVRQGRGSVIYARPAAQEGRAEIGGRVVSDETRSV